MSAKRGTILELMDEYIDPANAEKDSLKIIEKIQPGWNLQDVKFKPCPGAGFINTMLICYTDEVADDWLIFRIYGEGMDHVLNHQDETMSAKTLHATGLSPYIHCFFKNGMCMQYIKGKPFTWQTIEDFKSAKVFKSIARELAAIHGTKTMAIALENGFDANIEVARIEQACRGMIENWPSEIGEKEAEEFFRTMIPSVSFYKAELEDNMATLKKNHPTLTFCHCEPNPTNVVYVEEKDRAYLVDYDFSSLGYYTLDLAIFLEFSAVGMAPDADGTLRHSDEYIKEFLREYLETKRSLGDLEHEVTDVDIERLFVLTMKAMVATYLIYSMGFIMVAKTREERHGVSKKDFVGVAYNLYCWYAKNKDRIMSMEEPDLND